MISADEGGFIEYWQPIEPFVLPKNIPGLWSYKSETDLYEFKKVSFILQRYPLYLEFETVKINSNVYYTVP